MNQVNRIILAFSIMFWTIGASTICVPVGMPISKGWSGNPAIFWDGIDMFQGKSSCEVNRLSFKFGPTYFNSQSQLFGGQKSKKRYLAKANGDIVSECSLTGTMDFIEDSILVGHWDGKIFISQFPSCVPQSLKGVSNELGLILGMAATPNRLLTMALENQGVLYLLSIDLQSRKLLQKSRIPVSDSINLHSGGGWYFTIRDEFIIGRPENKANGKTVLSEYFFEGGQIKLRESIIPNAEYFLFDGTLSEMDQRGHIIKRANLLRRENQ
jgi:hypothetical protein